MRLLLPLFSLFLSVMLVQFATGGLGPLDALSGYALNFSLTQIGLLGSAQFLGFIIGCWVTPVMVGNFGHVRIFAALVGFGVIGILLHVLILNPYYWAFFRFISGVSVAGVYTIIESWLQAKATNETRGRIMGGYRFVDLLASLGAQLVISVLEPAAYISYNILALIFCLALFPMLFSRINQPNLSQLKPRLRPLLPFRYSPLGAVAVIISGLTASAFRMISPIYGQEVGLSVEEISYFLVAFVLGGALAQYPLGMLADRFDRRIVIVGLSTGAVISSFLSIMHGSNDATLIYVFAAFFGFFTFPIYSVAVAHANDFCTDAERLDISAALVFLFGVGAIISPLLAAQLIKSFGPSALYIFIALAHILLILYSLFRSLIRPISQTRVPYIYVPRTSFTIVKILGFKNTSSQKDAAPPSKSE